MIKSFYRLFLLFFVCQFQANAQEIFKLNSAGGGFNTYFGYQGYDGSDYFKSNVPLINCSSAYKSYADAVAGTLTESSATFKQPNSGLLSMGFQGFGLVNSFILGGEMNFGLGALQSGVQVDSIFNLNTLTLAYSARNESATSSRNIAMDVLFNVGFVAVRKRGLVIYPMMGIGYGASGLWLKSQSTQRIYPSVTDVVTATDRNLQNLFVWTKSPVLDLGIGAQYMLGASTEDQAKGFSLGIRLGYKMQFATNRILINANKNAADSYDGDVDLPKVGYAGPYVRLLIGFARIGENR